MEKLQKYTPSDRMSDLIEQDPRILSVIGRFGIGFGFGDNSVKKACDDHGVDPETFLAVIRTTFDVEAAKSNDPSKVSPEHLLDYLVSTHRYYRNCRMPEIRRDLVELWEGPENDLSRALLDYYDDMVEMVVNHTGHEERELFPYVRSLAAAVAGKTDADKKRTGKPKHPINIHNLSAKHHPIRVRLSELRRLLIKYYTTSDVMRMNSVLFSIYNCEFDLIAHSRVEDNLLLPVIAWLEEKNREKTSGVSQTRRPLDQKNSECAAPPPCSVPKCAKCRVKRNEPLSPREKDIIVYIANGLTNKQIAQLLHLSHLTVGTHRRNISTKLDIHTISGLTVYAISNGLIRLDELDKKKTHSRRENGH